MKKLSRKLAIVEMCKECNGCDIRRAALSGHQACGNGNNIAMEMVRECEDKNCPLWPFRSGTPEEGYSNRKGNPDAFKKFRQTLTKTEQNRTKTV